MFFIHNKVISPTQRFKNDHSVPSHVIFCHHPSTFQALSNIEKDRIICNVKNDSYKLTTFMCKGLEIALVHVYFGATAALHRMIEYYVKGASFFIDIAASGAINQNLSIGDIVLVSEAIRKDGVSDLFATKNEHATPDLQIFDNITKVCDANKIDYHIGTTWTTGSIYGYTYKKVIKMRNKEVQCVESEVATILIGAKWLTKSFEKKIDHKAHAASILYISDILPNPASNKSWISQLDSPKDLLSYKEKCLKIAIATHLKLHENQCLETIPLNVTPTLRQYVT